MGVTGVGLTMVIGFVGGGVGGLIAIMCTYVSLETCR